jgi:hypothetical protein
MLEGKLELDDGKVRVTLIEAKMKVSRDAKELRLDSWRKMLRTVRGTHWEN